MGHMDTTVAIIIGIAIGMIMALTWSAVRRER